MPVLFDTEFSAWPDSMANRWLAPGEFREIVQIGAVKLAPGTLATIDTFEILVKPRLNPVLSDYFVKLTGITNEAVIARGVDFPEAFERFVSFVGSDRMAAFGRDDLVLAENLALYGIHDAPSLPHHTNIAIWLRDNGIHTGGLHACDVAEACGVPFEGRKHDALDDSRSLAEGVRALIARGARNPFQDGR
jgi:inhibitor of KinA sporulation pathway (predicted exonuclease)